jgi:hypothetical protein
MKKERSFETEVTEFVQLLRQKGYRGRFLLGKITRDRQMSVGDLESCLLTFLKIYQETNGKNPLLQLETNVPYNDDLRCIFNVAFFGGVDGFKVSKMEIIDIRNNKNKIYKITHNNQVPGSQAVLGLFPKPKPWRKHAKGRRPF